jgi:hypothetical protein
MRGSEGYDGVPSNFTWKSADIGELRVEGNRGRFDFRLPGFAAAGTFHDRVPWSSGRPNSAGPEVSVACLNLVDRGAAS